MTNKSSLYVYYKVPSAENKLFLSNVKNMQHAIRARYQGVRTQLQKRPNCDKKGQETWMEIYMDIPSSQLSHIIADLEEFTKTNGLSSERSNEIFIDL